MSDKKKILVIDDEADVRTYLSTVLEDNDYDVEVAVDGQDGMDKAKARRPDLITLDITMPEKSGVKFYRQMREDDDTKSIPIVIITGMQPEFEKFISSRKQVPPPDGYLQKPVDPKDVLDAINKLLG